MATSSPVAMALNLIPEERTEMYNQYILQSTTDDIKLLPIQDAPKGKSCFWEAARLWQTSIIWDMTF